MTGGLSHRRCHHPRDGRARSGHRQRGEPGKDLRIKPQAWGVGNAPIRIERLWSLPDRVRALHHPRTLRDMCECQRVGENRCSQFASRETTSPLMDESAGRKNTSDEPASFPADWSSRGTITLYQSSAVFYVTNVRNHSVTGLDRVSRPAVMNYFESEPASDSTRILAVAWTAA